MKHLRLTLALAALAFAPTLAKASPITYTFNQTYTEAPNVSFTVTGTLSTDGVIGTVAASDISGYDLFVSETTNLAFGPVTKSAELSTVNSSLDYVGGLNASAGSLSFNFSGSNGFYFAGGGLAGILAYNSSNVNFGDLGIGVVSVNESGPTVIATVVPSSVTPEPSSLLLLGTGVLGLAGALRRRLVGGYGAGHASTAAKTPSSRPGKHTSRFACFALTLAVALMASTEARATPGYTTFLFTGTCTDCSSPEGVLVLQDYTQGDALQLSNLVSFSYSSSVAAFSLTPADFNPAYTFQGGPESPEFGGTLDSIPGSDTTGFYFDDPAMGSFGYDFLTSSDGTWSFGSVGPIYDYGTNGVWSLAATGATPEPSSLWLLGTGVLGLAGAARRRFLR